MKELIEIQSRLRAPKGQTNAFGKYKYRSCEDILESVKPILADLKCSILLKDEVVQVGERYYVKASVILSSSEDAVIMGTAYAREPLAKKGMDEAQITGATSSYARKYALNGLFAIDDVKDADTMDNTGHNPPKGVIKPGMYKIQAMGKSRGWVDRALVTLDKKDLSSSITYWDNQVRDKGEPLKGNLLEDYEMVKLYLNAK